MAPSIVIPVVTPVVFPQSINMGPIVSTSPLPLPPGDSEAPDATGVSVVALILPVVRGWLYLRIPELKKV
jgi:hypothetical protein